MSRRARPDQDANGHLRGSSPVPAKTGFWRQAWRIGGAPNKARISC